MEPFPFSEEEWSQVEEVSLAVTNATLADDDVLRSSTYMELEELVFGLCRKYGEHPVLLETLADFESNPARQMKLYREAIQHAERFELSTVSIRMALATVLLELFHDPSEALQVLMACERELATHDDESDLEAWTSLKRKCETSSQARRADRK
jgi:hypothetical protein